MTILTVFKNHIPNSQYIFKNGKAAAFLNGKFVTAIESEITELMTEIEAMHPHIYIDETEKTLDTEALSPMETILKQEYDKAYAQAKADLLKAGNYLDPERVTTSSQGASNASFANTLSINEGAAGSDSTNTPASTSNANSTNAATGAQLMSASGLAALSAMKSGAK